MTLENFKGIKSLTVDFTDQTTIAGANGTGKTTLFDAFLWGLFGKDSADRKDFNVKTIDAQGNAIPDIEHAVTLVIDQDGIETTFKRILREMWVKRRGDEERTFTGNETAYFVNDVPHKAGEYDAKVAGICNEGLFKLITSPTYFNEVLKWEQRREMLIRMAGDVSDTELCAGNASFSALLEKLQAERKSIKEYKAEVSAKRKNLKSEIEAIPTRIDECHKATPEKKDWDAIRKEIATKQGQIADIEASLADSTRLSEAQAKEQAGIRSEIRAKQQALEDLCYNLQSKQRAATMEYREKRQQIQFRKDAATRDIERLTGECSGTRQDIATLEARLIELRDKWNATNAKTIDFQPGQFICPTCKREFEASDIEAQKNEMTSSFNAEKVKSLAKINEVGISTKLALEERKKYLESVESDITHARARLDVAEKELSGLTEPATSTLDELIAKSEQHKQLTAEIAALNECLSDVAPSGNEELKARKAALTSEIDALKTQLHDLSRINELTLRIDELQGQLKGFAQQLADIERDENTIEQFEKARIDAVEGRINEMFSVVRFRMFRTLINGTLEPCCEATVDGVPYNDVNHAGKINAGLDIISALSKANDTYAPIWIDNAEAVNQLYEIPTQTIRLVVTNQTHLTIN